MQLLWQPIIGWEPLATFALLVLLGWAPAAVFRRHVRPGMTQWVRVLFPAAAGFFIVAAMLRDLDTPSDAGVSPRTVLLIDASLSMHATDVLPTRLDRAKDLASGLLQRLNSRGPLSVGLVCFGQDVNVLSPVTQSAEFLRQSIADLGADSIRLRGTDLRVGLQKAGEIVRGGATTDSGIPTPPGSTIVMISDGEGFDFDWKTSSEQLAQQGVRVFCLGLGDAIQGSRIPLTAGSSLGGYLSSRGEEVWTRQDPATLGSIADRTGGRYFNVDYDWDINELMGELDPVARLDSSGGFAFPVVLLGFVLLAADWLWIRRPSAVVLERPARVASLGLIVVLGLGCGAGRELPAWKANCRLAQDLVDKQSFSEAYSRLLQARAEAPLNQHARLNYDLGTTKLMEGLNRSDPPSLRQACRLLQDARSLNKDNGLIELIRTNLEIARVRLNQLEQPTTTQGDSRAEREPETEPRGNPGDDEQSPALILTKLASDLEVLTAQQVQERLQAWARQLRRVRGRGDSQVGILPSEVVENGW